ncbi:MAG: hypothetical protein CMI12_14100 [Oceanospirillum sp.]|nr:hypothetical protein [Oceanospirillum sp.]
MPGHILPLNLLARRLKPHTRLLLTGSLVAMLSACGTTAPRQTTGELPHQQSSTRSISADELLALAENSHFEQAQIYRFKAAEILAQESKSEAALRLLNKIQADRLPLELQKRFVFLSSRLSLEAGESWQALLTLNNTGVFIYDRLSPTEQLILTQYRAQAYSMQGNYELSAREYLTLSQQQIGKNQQQAYEGLWQNILNISLDDLRPLLADETNFEMRGWLDLARMRKEAAANLDQFALELSRWQSEWYDHPAALSLPKDMAFLDEISRNPVQHIAVFLPQSGNLSRAGLAIREGLMAASLDAKAQGAKTSQLSFYDSNTMSLDEMYRKAKAAGAEVVVGPLTKDKVSALQQRSRLPLPTLALNYGTQNQNNNKQLFQFAISPEDEANQAAKISWQDGHKSALTLTANSDWGSRALSAFDKQWQQQGGKVVGGTRYSSESNLAISIKEMLEVDKSEARLKRMRTILGTNLEFEPRRRKDVDMLFMAATPAIARQVKPALAFYYASDLPVYATSHLYNGKTNQTRDIDLNGINFCDIPWFLEESSGLKFTIDNSWPIDTERYGRLYAMGVDALQLAGRLLLLEAIPGSKVYGATGALSLREDRSIERQLQWATFIEGQPVLRHHLSTPSS